MSVRVQECWAQTRRESTCVSHNLHTHTHTATAAKPRRVAGPGDLVTIHYTLRDGDTPTDVASSATTTILDSSKDSGQPLTFEVGAGDVAGNPLFSAFDDLVRGLAPGEATSLTASGEPWTPDLCWRVPADHPEVVRLGGRYQSQGGLAPGLVVELANGARAVVVGIDPDDASVTLDANDMLAGKTRVFELELVSIADG